MTRPFRKRMNDGGRTGLKQDRFRNSRFEFEEDRGERGHFGGVWRSDANTLGGIQNENRGRRNADDRILQDREENPFENGGLSNWNHRRDWDHFFDGRYDPGANKRFGGALAHHDGSHVGKGPRGYRRSDEDIFIDVCEALTLSPFVDASDIEVDVREGCVYLNGTVESRQAKKMAEYSIENVSGIHDVQNLLTIEGKASGYQGRAEIQRTAESRH